LVKMNMSFLMDAYHGAGTELCKIVQLSLILPKPE
jgi:hypothetical protein